MPYVIHSVYGIFKVKNVAFISALKDGVFCEAFYKNTTSRLIFQMNFSPLKHDTGILNPAS